MRREAPLSEVIGRLDDTSAEALYEQGHLTVGLMRAHAPEWRNFLSLLYEQCSQALEI